MRTAGPRSSATPRSMGSTISRCWITRLRREVRGSRRCWCIASNRRPPTLTPANVLIEGGESITGITALWIAPASPPPPQATPAEDAYFAQLANPATILVVRTSVAGDFSPYTFRLVNDAAQASQDPFDVTEALAGFDPQLAEVAFPSRSNVLRTSTANLPMPTVHRIFRRRRRSIIWPRIMGLFAPSCSIA